MRLSSIVFEGHEQAAVVTDSGLVPVVHINSQLNKTWPTDLFSIIETGIDHELAKDAAEVKQTIDAGAVKFAPLYRHPRKIWGIGLNYLDHAKDLDAPYPTEPASFMKNDNTIIGPGAVIQLPPQSERVTAEDMVFELRNAADKLAASGQKVAAVGPCSTPAMTRNA